MSVPNTAGVPVRAEAARVLDAVMHHGRSLKAELAQALPTLADHRDRGLLEAIVFAALRGRAAYAQMLGAWMSRPPGRRDGLLRALLYVGLAQLHALRLPPHAALAATVEAARVLGRAHQAGLVNAVLRRAGREAIGAVAPDALWPRWLRARVRADWPRQASEIFAASARQAPSWLRVNRHRLQVAEYRQALAGVGIAAEPRAGLADALCLAGSAAVAALPGFAQGWVSVQDGGAQLSADALAPPSGARVLDACAAPGGKAAHLLERDRELRLTALELDPHRAQRMAEGFARLGLAAQICVGDATMPQTWWDGVAFDAILIDAPCSATGIVRRQPDVLLHRRASDLDALLAVQAQLLDRLWPLLAPGGALVYVTCSILRAENQQQIEAFLGRTKDARAQPLDVRFGRCAGVGRQRLPGEQDMDGFFHARLCKRPE